MNDFVTLTINGGRGGHGCISLSRVRYLPHGGPDGGDGGSGADVYFVASESLREYSRNLTKVFRGPAGSDGLGAKRTGKSGGVVRIEVPLGTTVWDLSYGLSYKGELLQPGEELLAAQGGLGGRGNVHFASSTNKTPLIAETGERGEKREYTLELQVIADVAVIGKPNSGKSSLLKAMTGAGPLIAEYPFTTREPIIGVAEHNWDAFSILELPGLLRGASQGQGLGNGFLRHLWRPRLHLYLLDGQSADVVGDLKDLRDEVAIHDPSMVERPYVVVVSGKDLPDVAQPAPALRKRLASYGMARYFVSGHSGEGIDDLRAGLNKLLAQIPAVPRRQPEGPSLLPPRSRTGRPSVMKDSGVFVVSSPPAERLVVLPDMRQFKVRLQLREELARLGVLRALEEAGVKHGDTVRIGTREFQWE